MRRPWRAPIRHLAPFDLSLPYLVEEGRRFGEGSEGVVVDSVEDLAGLGVTGPRLLRRLDGADDTLLAEPQENVDEGAPVVTAKMAAARQALGQMVALQDRLYRIAGPLLINNADLCRKAVEKKRGEFVAGVPCAVGDVATLIGRDGDAEMPLSPANFMDWRERTRDARGERRRRGRSCVHHPGRTACAAGARVGAQRGRLAGHAGHAASRLKKIELNLT